MNQPSKSEQHPQGSPEAHAFHGQLLRLYGGFERGVAAVLLLGMIVVICLAAWSFLRSTADAVMASDAILDYRAFQTLFDRVLAAVIALELAHSVHQMVTGKHGLAQVKTVIIIGILACVRKLILLEIDTSSGAFLLGLGGMIVALGAIYALVHWIEQRGFNLATHR